MIYKYNLNHLPGLYTVELPLDCEILSVKAQNNNVVLYVLTTPEKYKSSIVDRYQFQIVYTGDPETYPNCNASTFLDTVMLENDQLVLHIFNLGLHSQWDRKTQHRVYPHV